MRYMATAIATALAATPLAAQTSAPNGSITLYSFPAYFGSSVTITTATTDLAKYGFAAHAQSAKVTGSWTVCTAAAFKGTCSQLTTSAPTLALNGLNNKIVSLKPIGGAETSGTSSTASATTSATVAGTTAAAGASTKVDLSALDVAPGKTGQDTTFFATPAMGGSQISAGANDKTAGDAFCKQAGFASSVYAARARVQAAGLIDLATSTKTRAYALRDVLCAR